MPYPLVVFDAYGTLLDVYSIRVLAEQLYPGHGAQIAALWREKQVEYTRLVTLADTTPDGSRYYRDFWELTRLALRYTLRRHELPESVVHEEALMQQYAKLQPHPENLEVLQELKRRGVATAVLSNGNAEMLGAGLANAGFTPLIDAVLSADTLRQYKIRPAVYALALQRFPQWQARDVLFVSSNAWDALGATWFGFDTLWIDRKGLPPETLGPPPRHMGTDLRAVLGVVN
jgi:2-haloacid dehalogenase